VNIVTFRDFTTFVGVRFRRGAVFALKFVSLLPEAQTKYGFYDCKWSWTLL